MPENPNDLLFPAPIVSATSRMLESEWTATVLARIRVGETSAIVMFESPTNSTLAPTPVFASVPQTGLNLALHPEASAPARFTTEMSVEASASSDDACVTVLPSIEEPAPQIFAPSSTFVTVSVEISSALTEPETAALSPDAIAWTMEFVAPSRRPNESSIKIP